MNERMKIQVLCPICKEWVWTKRQTSKSSLFDSLCEHGIVISIHENKEEIINLNKFNNMKVDKASLLQST